MGTTSTSWISPKVHTINGPGELQDDISPFLWVLFSKSQDCLESVITIDSGIQNSHTYNGLLVAIKKN